MFEKNVGLLLIVGCPSRIWSVSQGNDRALGSRFNSELTTGRCTYVELRGGRTVWAHR
jgi:hypothetical protein